MRLDEIAARVGARVIAGGTAGERSVGGIISADRVSDILNGAGPGTLLVTGLTGPQVLRVAELLDIPGICLLGSKRPGEDFASAAESQKTFVMHSSRDARDACARISALLSGERQVTE